jgi:hypothetical protein
MTIMTLSSGEPNNSNGYNANRSLRHAHRVQSPVIASKQWKQRFRQACLSRMTQRVEYGATDENDTTCNHTSPAGSPSWRQLRSIVDDTMRQEFRVAIASSSTSTWSTRARQSRSLDEVPFTPECIDMADVYECEAQAMMDTFAPSILDEDLLYTITEEELNELLVDLQAELQHPGNHSYDDLMENHVQQGLDIIESEQAALEQQIAEYEGWDCIHRSRSIGTCSLCHCDIVQTSSGTIVCSQSWTGKCSLKIIDNSMLYGCAEALFDAECCHSLDCSYELSVCCYQSQTWAQCWTCRFERSLPPI